MNATAVIVAAGKGERFGDTAKVMANLHGRPLLAYSLDAFQASPLVSEVIIVAGHHTDDSVKQLMGSGGWTKIRAVVAGGSTRQESSAHGVAAARPEADVILVHDAARPLITTHLIDLCIQTAFAHGAAIVAAPVTDTIKRVSGGKVTETIDRSVLWSAQTPQAFRADVMKDMITRTIEHTTYTDEASLAEALGIPVMIVPGDVTNLKITHPGDLAVAEALLQSRRKDQLS